MGSRRVRGVPHDGATAAIHTPPDILVDVLPHELNAGGAVRVLFGSRVGIRWGTCWTGMGAKVTEQESGLRYGRHLPFWRLPATHNRLGLRIALPV